MLEVSRVETKTIENENCHVLETFTRSGTFTHFLPRFITHENKKFNKLVFINVRLLNCVCLHGILYLYKMEVLHELLNSYSGRDSVIRAVSYLSLYFSGHTRGTNSLKFKKISEELSHCRLILRLFDDLPMLRHTVTYGLGEKVRLSLFYFFFY